MRTARALRRSLWVAPLAGVLSAVLLTAVGLRYWDGTRWTADVLS